MSEDQFDDDGAPPPPLDEHDREMRAMDMEIISTDNAGEVVCVDISPLRVEAAQRYLADTLVKSIIPLDVMHLEVAIALANLYAGISLRWLRECDDLIVFQNNRDALLNVLGLLSAQVNEIPYPLLAEEPMASLKVH